MLVWMPILYQAMPILPLWNSSDVSGLRQGELPLMRSASDLRFKLYADQSFSKRALRRSYRVRCSGYVNRRLVSRIALFVAAHTKIGIFVDYYCASRTSGVICAVKERRVREKWGYSGVRGAKKVLDCVKCGLTCSDWNPDHVVIYDVSKPRNECRSCRSRTASGIQQLTANYNITFVIPY